MDEAAARIREALQFLLDVMGDGWTLTQHVVVMGLERVTDGQIEATSWYWHPVEQPEWMTSGLMESALDIRDSCDYDD